MKSPSRVQLEQYEIPHLAFIASVCNPVFLPLNIIKSK